MLLNQQTHKSNFENVNSDKSVYGYIGVPRVMGLTYVKDGHVLLTDESKKVLQTKDLSYLYEVISYNVLAFDDIVEFLKTTGEPQSEHNILVPYSIEAVIKNKKL
ncbi:MAG: hypothetical protein GY797_22325 [Deltaproteobacteria bacterium]|nr:hypothetical protein [Deltaproteobacteria bacterium]